MTAAITTRRRGRRPDPNIKRARELERLAAELERDARRARAGAAALRGRPLPGTLEAVEALRDPAYRRTA